MTDLIPADDDLLLAHPAAPPPGRPTVDQMVLAWLDAKAHRSGSTNTARAYTEAIGGFRAVLQPHALDLDAAPAGTVATAAQGWAGQGNPSPATFNQRLAILSSCYQFCIKRGWLVANPIVMVERRTVQGYAAAQALSYTQVRDNLAAIDRSTLAGARDYALLAVALQTGRRVAEIAGWRCGDVTADAAGVILTTRRAKGGKVMQDRLPAAVGAALLAWLRMLGDQRDPDAPLWINLSRRGHGSALTPMSISRICERHLGTSKVHALRHTFARAMEDTGAKVSEIQARLGHSSLATTSRYLAALRSAENPHAEALAALLGLDTP